MFIKFSAKIKRGPLEKLQTGNSIVMLVDDIK